MTEPRPTPSPTELHRRKRQAVISSLVLGVLTVLLVGALITSYVRNAPLRGEGLVTTQAVVTDFEYHLRSSDEVSVRYDVPGAGSQEADIPVSRRFATGDAIEVSYAPAQPGLVRTVDGWAPNYRTLWGWLLPAVPMVALVVSIVGIVRPATMAQSEPDRKWKMGPLGLNWGVWGALIAVGLLVVLIGFVSWLRSLT